jgi:hypothetical protein
VLAEERLPGGCSGATTNIYPNRSHMVSRESRPVTVCAAAHIIHTQLLAGGTDHRPDHFN